MEISRQRLQMEFNPPSLLESEKYKFWLLVALGILESLAVYPPGLIAVYGLKIRHGLWKLGPFEWLELQQSHAHL